MNLYDTIGHIDRVLFEEVAVNESGRIETFQADVHVQADGCDYVFTPAKIYVHQTGPDGDDFFPAKTETRLQQLSEMALRVHVHTDPKAIEYLTELADAEGLSIHLMEAA